MSYKLQARVLRVPLTALLVLSPGLLFLPAPRWGPRICWGLSMSYIIVIYKVLSQHWHWICPNWKHFIDTESLIIATEHVKYRSWAKFRGDKNCSFRTERVWEEMWCGPQKQAGVLRGMFGGGRRWIMTEAASPVWATDLPRAAFSYGKKSCAFPEYMYSK